MKNLISLILIVVVLMTSCKEQSPYVKGIVTGKQRIAAHYSTERRVIINEAGFGGGFRSSGFRSSSYRSSSRSSYRSSASSSRSYRSYRSISASRPSYARSYRPNSRSYYKAPSGRYYCPVVETRYQTRYIHDYNMTSHTNNMLLMYILISNNSRANSELLRFYLPEYKLEVLDSAQNKEWVSVDSIRYYTTRKGESVNFKRYSVATYEDEGGNW